jgi:hypothetical protein
MRKTFAAGAAKSGAGCLTRGDRDNWRVFPITPQCNNSSRPPHKGQTIDYLDQRCVDYRDRSQLIELTRAAES